MVATSSFNTASRNPAITCVEREAENQGSVLFCMQRKRGKKKNKRDLRSEVIFVL